jgi:hypothetical protein
MGFLWWPLRTSVAARVTGVDVQTVDPVNPVNPVYFLILSALIGVDRRSSAAQFRPWYGTISAKITPEQITDCAL